MSGQFVPWTDAKRIPYEEPVSFYSVQWYSFDYAQPFRVARAEAPSPAVGNLTATPDEVSQEAESETAAAVVAVEVPTKDHT